MYSYSMTRITLALKRLRWRALNLLDDMLVLAVGDKNQYDIKCEKRNYGSGDGRWCVAPEHLNSESVVYSFGVGNDVSFDMDVWRRHGCCVHLFDPTPISKEWIATQRLPKSLIFHDIGLADHDGKATFRLPKGHSVSFSPISVLGDTEREHAASVQTLATIMKHLGHESIDLLKIDIEGGEYSVINDIVDHRESIEQLLVEFHDRMVSDGEQETREAIEKLDKAGFRLFHRSRRGFECSFVRSSAGFVDIK